MVGMHLVLPALNLYTLNAGILIMMHQVILMMFSLNMVDCSMSFLMLSSCNFEGQIGGNILELAVILVSAQVPLGQILVLYWVGVRARALQLTEVTRPGRAR